MEKREFVEFVCGLIEPKIHGKLKPKEVEAILSGLIEGIVRVVESGDQVRISGFGSFFPRAVTKAGTTQLVSARIGFNPFVGVNHRIEKKIKSLALYRTGLLSNIRMIAEGGKTRARDEEGRELFNLSEIARMSGLSYPTAAKYLGAAGDKVEVHETPNGNKLYPASAAQVLMDMTKRKVRKEVEKPFYTLTEVSRITGITTVTLYSYLKRYELKASETRGKRSLYNHEFVQKVLSIRQENQERWGG